MLFFFVLSVRWEATISAQPWTPQRDYIFQSMIITKSDTQKHGRENFQAIALGKKKKKNKDFFLHSSFLCVDGCKSLGNGVRARR